ncbi:hypothetical protein [Amycolatopsis alkalitolerans]|uniref:Uncharacterized protein n=1 Tax=Amycolatopsis alkalitolerans TaxID=2547244 RepID=A0A5C4LUS0_9PSEU|nr:hypothetical protein [Amycolatopsis alkalitolerans]TNC19071.1 hypothetical protein FG385_32920 [Amycolatopsis alkalitolerans]
MVAIAMMNRAGRAPGPETPIYGNESVSSAPRPPEQAPWSRFVVDRSGYYHGAHARTPGYENGRLIASDRHVIERRGKTSTSGREPDPSPGFPNADSLPAAPQWEMLNRTLSWQVGTDGTRNLDNGAFHASTTAGRRPFPLGNQGSNPQERVNGGTPGLYRPYGARGYVFGPEPRVRALPGGPYPVGTLLAPGAPQDGPQVVFGGYPHGRHTKTVPAPKWTQARYRATPQMKPGRQDRPANSKIAGQSYSQTVVHQDGSGGGPLPTIYGGRPPGMNAYWRST